MLQEPQKKNLSSDLSSLEEYLGGCDHFCGIVGTFRGGGACWVLLLTFTPVPGARAPAADALTVAPDP